MSRELRVYCISARPSYPLRAGRRAKSSRNCPISTAEGYAAGELKHGPIALIDFAMPVIVLAPH